MYENRLKQVHLSRLSPVMWGWKDGYPRKQLGVPIKPAYNGMGSYEAATEINPKGSPIWSETWQQRAAGALRRVSPYAMDGCCPGVGTTNNENQSRPWLGLGIVMAIGVGLLYWHTR